MRLVVASSFPVHPVRGGGQERIRGLFGALVAQRPGALEVDVVTLAPIGTPPRTHTLEPGLREIRVPKTRDHELAEVELMDAVGLPVTDVALSLHHDLTPAYGDALDAAAEGASAAFASQGYGEPALRAACPQLPLVYESHNVEADLKAGMVASLGEATAAREAFVETVRGIERACCERAGLVLACSTEDVARLHELYGAEPAAMPVVPSGGDAATVAYAPLEERARLRALLGVDDRPLLLFVGSAHTPNLDAAAQIAAAAARLPGARFLLAGSVGLPLDHEALPGNVEVLGLVAEAHLATLLRIVDAALNPMRLGSGTNLKMIRYAMAGAPIVSTEFGARGLGFSAGEHYRPMTDLAEAVETLLAEPAHEVERRARAAREHALATLDWRVIAERLLADERFAGVLRALTPR